MRQSALTGRGDMAGHACVARRIRALRGLWLSGLLLNCPIHGANRHFRSFPLDGASQAEVYEAGSRRGIAHDQQIAPWPYTAHLTMLPKQTIWPQPVAGRQALATTSPGIGCSPFPAGHRARAAAEAHFLSAWERIETRERDASARVPGRATPSPRQIAVTKASNTDVKPNAQRPGRC